MLDDYGLTERLKTGAQGPKWETHDERAESRRYALARPWSVI
jgi:hypothetical protein